MDRTSATLLDRLRQPGDTEAWARFVHLYTPLLFHWARRAGLREDEAADLVQDVLTLLVQKLPEFAYDPARSFRGWLRAVTLNQWRQRCRRAVLPVEKDSCALAGVAAPAEDDPFWEAEYRQHLVGQALRLMQAEFQPTTWQACWQHVVDGKSAAEVASALGMTAGAVRAAKFRVLSRLRRELAGLLE
jgi:RNA polymerase sigma-70 factor (ECF subfamily)